MTNTTTPSLPLPDLSLQISPPSVFEAKEVMSYDGLLTRKAVLHSDRSSTTDSGSSGSDLSHENGGFYPVGTYNLGLTEPMLSLGFEMSDLSPSPVQLPRNHHHQQQQQHHQHQHQHQHQHHHNHQPQIYGREFKRNSRLISGVKRSVRAPRMRWTTTLHAHFVHAVELLGGHESNNIEQVLHIYLYMFILKC